MRFFIAMLILVLAISLTTGTAMAGSPFKELCLKAMGITTKTVARFSSPDGSEAAAPLSGTTRSKGFT